MPNPTREYIVLLGPHAALCERAVGRGLGVIVVDDKRRLDRGVIELADHVLVTDYEQQDCVADLLGSLMRTMRLVGVLSLTEPGLLIQAKLNSRLGFADNRVDVVERVVDKAKMRAWLDQDPSYRLPFVVARDQGDVAAFVRSVGYPVIAKPTDGVGSRDVWLIDADEALRRASRAPFPLIVERCALGREYSVESISFDGRHRVVAVTEKTLRGTGPGRFVEAGHCVPAPLSDETAHRLRRYVEEFLTLMGIEWGVTHTEVIAEPDGFVIVETHTRNGGDRIVDLVAQACEFDLLDAAVAIRAGDASEAFAAPTAAVRAACVRFLFPKPGRVTSLVGVRTARSQPGVMAVEVGVAVGDDVRDVRTSQDRSGLVLALGDTPEEAVKRAERALRTISIRTD